MLVVGIGHKKRRGKDALTAYIIKTWSGRLDIRRYAFGDILKQEVNAAARAWWLENCPDQLFGAQGGMRALCQQARVPLEENPDFTDPMCPYGKQRRLLQWWGTEYRRVQFGEHYWTDRLWDIMRHDNPQVALVPDTRFPNEADSIRLNDGYLIRVTRPNFNPSDDHISETALDNYTWDETIMANTVEELEIAGRSTFEGLFKRRGLI